LELSNRIPPVVPGRTKNEVTKYNEGLQSLTEILTAQKDEIVGKPEPFYKPGIRTPAGYVIETKEEIIVAYHGTNYKHMGDGGFSESIDNMRALGTKATFGKVAGNVHSGFLNQYNKSKDSLYEILDKLVDVTDAEGKKKTLHFSGHSLGGAVAQIAALDAQTNNNREVSAVSTFGSPRVFFSKLADVYDKVGLSKNTIRVIDSYDPIPRLNPKRSSLRHVGPRIIMKSGNWNSHSRFSYNNMIDKINDDRNLKLTMPEKRKNSLRNFTASVMEMTKKTFNELLKEAKLAYIEGGSKRIVDDMKRNLTPLMNIPLIRNSLKKNNIGM
jgi:hypothetical protein